MLPQIIIYFCWFSSILLCNYLLCIWLLGIWVIPRLSLTLGWPWSDLWRSLGVELKPTGWGEHNSPSISLPCPSGIGGNMDSPAAIEMTGIRRYLMGNTESILDPYSEKLYSTLWSHQCKQDLCTLTLNTPWPQPVEQRLYSQFTGYYSALNLT